MKQVRHYPSFHDVVTLRLPPERRPMRVIITEHGVFQPLVDYFRFGAGRAYSLAWQRKVAHSVGLLFDFTVAFPPPSDQAALGAYLQEFVATLERGTVDASFSDPRGLYWLPAKREKLREVAGHIVDFTDFLAASHRQEPLVATVPATVGERLARLRRLDKQNDNAMLRHLHDRVAQYEQANTTRALRTKRTLRLAHSPPPAFPDTHFRRLLEDGFGVDLLHPRGADSSRLRDALIVVLQRCGGLRASEALHLFVDDVDLDSTTGAAHVVLAHPEEAEQQVQLKTGDGVRTLTRTQYLQLVYNRAPRTQMGGSEHLGWKGCEVDKALGYRARVYWVPSAWGIVFARLYTEYLRRRPRGVKHPYLFVAFRDDHRGAPYAIGQYHKNFAAAVRRIGLPSQKPLGTTTHGLRHAYMQTLVDLEIAPQDRKLMIRHASLQSQEAYTRSTHDRIHRVLAAAAPRLAALDAGVNPPPAPLPAAPSPAPAARAAVR